MKEGKARKEWAGVEEGRGDGGRGEKGEEKVSESDKNDDPLVHFVSDNRERERESGV